MYQPERKDFFYFMITLTLASLIGWYFLNTIRPALVERSCSEIAEKSSSMYSGKREEGDPFFQYNNLKARCLEETKYEVSPLIKPIRE